MRDVTIFAKRVLAIVLCFPLVLVADGNSFKVRYNGGSVPTTVKPDDWDNKLSVAPDAIVLALKDGQVITISPKQVVSLSYGQEAHRRVGTAIGLAVLSLGIGALSALHKTKLHYIGINFNDKDGKKQGVLLQGDKENFRSLLVALQGVTGVPVSVGEKDRNEVPVGVATQVTKDEGNAKNNPDTETTTTATPATAPKVLAPATTMEALGTVEVTSDPNGAEVYADGAFVGSCPVTLKLKPGQHTVRVTQSGYTEWSRDITVQAGSIAHLNAKGEKATVAGTVALESTKVTESGSTPHRSVSTENKPTSPDSQAPGSVSITSDPNGASLFVDSIGHGQAPVIVKLSPGKHSFQLVMVGYKDWTSEVEVRSGSITNVSATLQK